MENSDPAKRVIIYDITNNLLRETWIQGIYTYINPNKDILFQYDIINYQQQRKTIDHSSFSTTKTQNGEGKQVKKNPQIIMNTANNIRNG